MGYVGGTPKILLEGDKARALELLPEGRKFYWRVRDLLATAGTATYSAVQDLDGGYVAVGFYGEVSSIMVFADQEYQAPLTVADFIPPSKGELSLGYYSGLIYSGRADPPDRHGVSILHTDESMAINAANTRSRAEPGLMVQPPLGEPNIDQEGRFLSQYFYITPGKYSGEMRKVVQALLGFGIQRNTNFLPNPSEVPNWVSSLGFQVRYDYKFSRTHGVHTAGDGSKWLIEISSTRGVLAMKLPTMDLGTTRIPILMDVEEELGYVPSGGVFPDNIGSAIAKGEVLQLLEPSGLTPLYSVYSPFYLGWGWSFNDNGSAACITGMRFAGDGHQESALFTMDIRIEPRNGKYHGYAAMSSGRKGWIWADNRKYSRFIPFKYPAYGFDHHVVSHDGCPLTEEYSPQKTTCDAPLFAAYIDNSLHVVNFFRHKSTTTTVDNSFSDTPSGCAYGGSWSSHYDRGTLESNCRIYTSFEDDRRPIAGTSGGSYLDSIDLGHGPGRFSDSFFCPRASVVFRSKYYAQKRSTWSISGETDGSAAAVPFGERCAYAYAHHRGWPTGIRRSESLTVESIQDPWRGYAVRCLGAVGHGCSIWPSTVDDEACGLNCHASFHGVHYHPDRRIIGSYYQPSGGCSYYADSGDWLTKCDSIDHWNDREMHLPEQYSRSWGAEFESSQTYSIYTPSGSTIRQKLEYGAWTYSWGDVSPDPDTGMMQQFSAVSNCLGNPMTRIPTSPGFAVGELRSFGSTELDKYYSGVGKSYIGLVR